MKKFLAKIALFALLSCALVGVLFFVSYFAMPEAFSDSYQRGFNYQYYALKNAGTEPKIMVLGGSHMTFATDTRLLSKLSGRPAYTLGVHSGTGMCYVFETAKQFVNKGDIVVFCFMPMRENDYGTDLIFLSFEKDFGLFWEFAKAHPALTALKVGSALYTKWYNLVYKALKRRFLKSDNKPLSVYHSIAFDERTGNMIYPRPGKDPTVPDSELDGAKYSFTTALVSFGSGASVLNKFNEFCLERGAKFYIALPPIYENSVENNDKELSGYEASLARSFDAPVISSIKETEVPKDCLYDFILHMNDKGVERYTTVLYNDLLRSGAF